MVTVYSKPSCVQCTATYKSLEREGVEYEVIDVTQDHDALAFVSELGYQAAPVVVYRDQHWSGFKPDRIKALALTRENQGENIDTSKN